MKLVQKGNNVDKVETKREKALIYINLYSPHNTVGTTGRMTDINKRNKHAHINT